jgi:periplasmic protein CpxP/Spy
MKPNLKHRLITVFAGAVMLLSPLAASTVHAQTPILSGVEITQEQDAKLAQIRSQTRSQIQAVLTPDQISQFKTALEQNQGLRKAIASMNLSADQKTQLRSIFQSTRTQLTSTFTPEQRQQLRQNVMSQLRQTFGKSAN